MVLTCTQRVTRYFNDFILRRLTKVIRWRQHKPSAQQQLINLKRDDKPRDEMNQLTTPIKLHGVHAQLHAPGRQAFDR